jgi:hypothetical protein
VQLRRARDRFEQAGAGLILIGQGSPRQAAHFHRRFELGETPLLADEDRRTYRLAGLRRGGAAQLVGPRSVAAGLRHAARSGVMQGRVVGDAAQLGGAAVVAPGGLVAFEHASAHAGDTVDPGDLLEAAGATV